MKIDTNRYNHLDRIRDDMNLLYLLGNGFDKNLNLPTSYSEFYNYYSYVPNDDEDIKRLKDHIVRYRNKDWADLELGLGKYTENIDSYEVLEKIYVDINLELKNYLNKVANNPFSYNKADLETFFNDYTHPYNKVTLKEQNFLKYYFDGILTNFLCIDTITFNYTKTLENLVKKCETHETIGFFNHKVYLEARVPIHIYQTIDDGGLILGVDNKSQIANKELAEDERVHSFLIKRNSYDSIGNLNDEKCETLINKADLICIYGLSLGKTDQSWWIKLRNHLLNSQCRVIYFVYSTKKIPIDQCIANYKIDMLSFFFERLGFEKDKVPQELKSRIFIVINSNIFKIASIKQSV